IAGTSTLLLLTCAVGQAAGRLVPLPGGLGGMEGGVLGALALTGTPPAAAAAVIVYRVAGFWALDAAGTTVAAALTRRRRGGPEPDSTTPCAAPPTPAAPPTSGDAPGPWLHPLQQATRMPSPMLGSRRHGSARSYRQRFHPQAPAGCLSGKPPREAAGSSTGTHRHAVGWRERGTPFPSAGCRSCGRWC